MGCLHIILGDRFNEELQNIYGKALKYLLMHMAKLYDKPYAPAGSNELDCRGQYENELGFNYLKSPSPPSPRASPTPDYKNEILEKMSVYSEKYKE